METNPLDTALLINPINPTGYRLIIIILLLICCVVSVTYVYIFLGLIFFFRAHSICLIGGMLK